MHPTLPPLLFGLALLTRLNVAAAEPWVPPTDEFELARVPRTPPSTVVRAVPPGAAMEEVRQWIALARQEGDPRYLSRAAGKLEGLNEESRDAEYFLVRAHVRQGLHDFTGAQADLDLALRQDPRHAGAWLMKTGLHQLRGEMAEARRALVGVLRFADELVATTATAAFAGLRETGSVVTTPLQEVLNRSTEAPPEVRAWAWVTLGEIHGRAGNAREAERCWRTALELEGPRPYALGALADLLLAQGRASEVLALVGDSPVEALRLRALEAETRLFPGSARGRAWSAELDEGWSRSAARGDRLHLRERTRFVLRSLGDAPAAVALARENWELQKEPADLELALEAAGAAGDRAWQGELEAWAREHQPAVLQSLKSRQPLATL